MTARSDVQNLVDKSAEDRTLNPAEPIAIVGMGCRLPGAKNVDQYWDLLERGGDAVRRVPAERWDADEFYAPESGTPGKTVLREGGFLDDIDQFDPYFFGISPREAVSQDPQQRLLLETVWEAMEDGGMQAEKMVDSRTGVYVGFCQNDYSALVASSQAPDASIGGSGPPVASGRISTVFGFSGPSVTVDTACSSSLTATHLACAALQNRECDTAFAAGVNAVLSPQMAIGLSQGGMLSPDARCKAFDASANGFVRSEGAAVVALKRLDDALADGDRIHAVIRGSAVSNDGSNSPLMTPSRPGQAAALRDAYARAGVEPRDVDYIEAHGTGTKVGDPIEIGALNDVIGVDRASDQPCSVGSSKTNIGHTEAAAGLAGVIKVVLSMRHRTIPASLHCETLNPEIPWDEVCLRVQREQAPWPDRERPPLAGVNSFGISGTNAHVVIEGPPQPAEGETRSESAGPQLLTLTGRSAEDLAELAKAYRDHLRSEAGRRSTTAEICRTAGLGRSVMEHRLAVPGADHEALAASLELFVDGEQSPGLSTGFVPEADDAKPVFVFSGAGSQWPSMARELRSQEPVFGETLLQIDELVRKEVGWSVIEEIDRPEEESRLREFECQQIAIFSVQVALAAVWKQWGIEPGAIVGHSLGEFAAAHVAGAVSLADAVRAVCVRGRLMSRISGKGAMLATALSPEEAAALIEGKEDQVAVGVINSPASTVLSGDPAILAEIMADLESRDVFCRMVKVDVASHSPQVEEVCEDLRRELQGLQAREASVPLYSSLTGTRMTGAEYGADYWVRSVREPVQFSKAVETLMEEGRERFLELSGHPLLAMPIRQTAAHFKRNAGVFSSLKRGEGDRGAMLSALGEMFVAGLPVEWDQLYPDGGRLVDLPLYPWRRDRYWVEGATLATTDRFLGHPMLHRHWTSATQPGAHVWEGDLNADTLSFLQDHRYQGSPLMVGVGYFEMALAASFRLHGPGPRKLRDVKLARALVFPNGEARTVQITLAEDKPGVQASFRIHSRDKQSQDDAVEWTLHCEGLIQYAGLEFNDELRPVASMEELEAKYGAPISSDEFYSRISSSDIELGESFRGVERIWIDREATDAEYDVACPSAVHDAARYHLHPGFFDSILHGYFAAAFTSLGAAGEALPVGVGEIEIRALPEPGKTYRGRSKEVLERPDLLVGSTDAYDAEGRLVVREVRREMQIVTTAEQMVEPWLYKMHWREAPCEPDPQSANASWVLLGDGGAVGAALRGALRGEGLHVVEGPDLAAEGLDRESASALLATVCEGLEGPVALVYLEALDGPQNDALDLPIIADSQRRICGGELLLAQAVAARNWPVQPRVFVLTRGAQRTGGEAQPVVLSGSCVLGLTRVLAGEHPALRPQLIDLDPAADPADVEALSAALRAWDDEKETALRGGKRLAARLARLKEFEESADRSRRVEISDDGSASCRLRTSGAGMVDNLRLQAAKRQAPGPGEVEVRTVAVGLNFIDVLRCYGMFPGQHATEVPFGNESAGRVVAVGEGVGDYRVGDEVVVLGGGEDGSAQAFVTVPPDRLFKKPAHLTFEEAAAMFVVYQTVDYSVVVKAELGPGEIILIHSAAGGVGLAAMEVAKQLGARIFATAGTEEKRELLRSLGAELVMDSHALDFEEEVLEYTGGRGVDVVLNSLAGQAIPKSLNCLAIGGRFVEIGKRDIYGNTQVGLWPFQKNLSYHAIDLLRLSYERPDIVSGVTRNVIERITDGTYKALPVTAFAADQAADAFRHMAKGAHIGKVVLQFGDSAEVDGASEGLCEIKPDATYLITGGLGALGLLFAEWIVNRGGRHLVLTGRRGATAETEPDLEALRAAGADVRAVAADISRPEDVDRLLDETRSMPPLRGVIHSAVVLDDGILQQLDWSRFETVFAPKIDGGWLLHEKLLGHELDFFALYSSAASSMGSPGQGNYAAANAFLDSLTHYRRSLGLPATGVNWGPWAEIGLAAAQANRGERLSDEGLASIPPRLGVTAFERLLGRDVSDALVLPINWAMWIDRHPEIALDPFYRDLASEFVDSESMLAGSSQLLESLKTATPEEAVAFVSAHLGEQVSKVLKVPESRLDPQISLSRFGLDSLMAVELKNRIETTLPLTIPVVNLIDGPSLSRLTEWVLEELNAHASGAAGSVPTTEAPATDETPPPKAQAAAVGLSQSQVDDMLGELLADEKGSA